MSEKVNPQNWTSGYGMIGLLKLIELLQNVCQFSNDYMGSILLAYILDITNFGQVWLHQCWLRVHTCIHLAKNLHVCIVWINNFINNVIVFIVWISHYQVAK